MIFKPMKIGLVGCGQITDVHRDGYTRFGLPVVAGTDLSADARAKFAKQEPQARVYDTLDDLLADPEIDVLDVAAPHRADIRRPLLEQVVEAGKPVLLQKPFGHYYADALVYCALFEKAGVPLMINQNSVFCGGVVELTRAILHDRTLGAIFTGRISNTWDLDPGDHPWYGKGERWWLTDMAVHELALLHHFMGAPVSVSAASGRDAAQRGVQGDGLFHMLLRYADGASVLVDESGAYYGPDRADFMIELQGEQGQVAFDPGKRAVISRRQPGASATNDEVTSPYRWFPEAFGLVMQHFQYALQTGQTPLCSAADNLHVMAVVEAAYLSAQTGETVQLKSIMGDRFVAGRPGGLTGPADWIAPPPVDGVKLKRDYAWATYTPTEAKA
jgi:predicted dehydrogenase